MEIWETANNLFEQARTKEWPKESLEETVQNAVKSWQMEFINKARLQDFKTINPEKFKLIVNGRDGLSGEEILKLGGFNARMQTSLPDKLLDSFYGLGTLKVLLFCGHSSQNQSVMREVFHLPYKH